MSPGSYTEDSLLQQTSADYLEQELACQSARAGNYGHIVRKWLISCLGCFPPCHTTIR